MFNGWIMWLLIGGLALFLFFFLFQRGAA